MQMRVIAIHFQVNHTLYLTAFCSLCAALREIFNNYSGLTYFRQFMVIFKSKIKETFFSCTVYSLFQSQVFLKLVPFQMK